VYNRKKAPRGENITYNELFTTHNEKSTAYNGKKSLQQDSTTYTDFITVHDEKSTTPYNGGISA